MIRTFEPRLTAIITTLTPPSATDQSIRFHIDAQLVMDPSPAPVSFDIVLPRHTNQYEVKDR